MPVYKDLNIDSLQAVSLRIIYSDSIDTIAHF